MVKLLMPKATAVWLIDNTALTFEQIAGFCQLHVLEVKGIADGEVASGMQGLDPVANGQTTKQAIEDAEKDSSLSLEHIETEMPQYKQKGPKYTPLSKRQDKPDGIAWLLKNFPKITDQEIIKLIGTTKTTIQAIRNRTHWNTQNIKPKDPVLLGLCRQSELNKLADKYQQNTDVADDQNSGESDTPKDASYYFPDFDAGN